MAYQPLYATIEDTNGTRGTHSLRSRVEWIRFILNSHFGKVMLVTSNSKGTLTDYSRVAEAEQKIKTWQEKGNNKKVLEWEQKLKESEKFNIEQEKQEQVTIDINIIENPKFKVLINGKPLSPLFVAEKI